MDKTKLLGWLSLVAGVASLLAVFLIDENGSVRKLRYPLIVIGIILFSTGIYNIKNLKHE